MKVDKISIIVRSFLGNEMFRTLPFLKIFDKFFNIQLIGGISKNTPIKSATHLTDDIFKKIDLTLFPLENLLKFYKNIFNFINYSRKLKGDVIVGYKTLPEILITSTFKKFIKKNFVIIDIDDFNYALDTGLEFKIMYQIERLKRFTDLIFAGSRILQKIYGGIYLPTPVDTNFFQKDNFDTAKIKKKYNLNDDIILLYIGTFKEHKGIKEIIDIFSLIKDNVKNVRLLMVGGNKNPQITKKYIDYGKKK
ncbi:MAG: glycosyltransferase, partial [Promethearchaeia archaeon]